MNVADGGQHADDAAVTPGLTDVTAAVCSLAELMSKHGLAKVDLTVGQVAIRLRSVGGSDVAEAVVPSAPATAAASPSAELVVEGHTISAPMIGTFYAAPAPGEESFVQVGDHIEVGQVIGIIEAMKIMNEIAADRAGTVAEILVQNAQTVEYGSPLMRVVA
jgi:acetyl-CoA carboxylase biotin carboxyl carrier protein